VSEEIRDESEAAPVPGDETVGEAGPKAKGRDVLTKIKDALDTALDARGNVIMVRVNDETLQAIDMLVEADVCKSRSEGAAFLINQGIQASHELYDRIGGITEQIAELKARLRQMVTGETEQ